MNESMPDGLEERTAFYAGDFEDDENLDDSDACDDKWSDDE